MLKYIKVKFGKYKMNTGDIFDRRIPIKVVSYSKKIGEKNGYHVWLLDDSEAKINKLLNHKFCKPRFEDGEGNEKKDMWYKKTYKNQTELNKNISKAERDNPGGAVEITETEAKTYLKSGVISDHYKPKTEKEILMAEIKSEGKVNAKVITLLEKLI